MNTPLLEVAGLVKHYHAGGIAVPAVNDVSLSIEAGEFVVVTGPSGCGKSTLLTVLGLLEQPDAGHIRFNGTQVVPGPEAGAARVRGEAMGFVFQNFNLLPQLTAEENVALPLELIRRGTRSERLGRAREQLDRIGLLDQARKFPEQMSGGQQQRVAIARALVASPRLVLADEPTGNLDSENSAAVMHLLHEINAHGTTVILVTHDPRYFEVGTRRLQLKDGRIHHDA